MSEEQNKNSAENIENTQSSENAELVKCETELKQIKDLYKLLMADFENYKKRTIRDNERIVLTAQSSIILKLLPVIDNLSRFFESATKNQNSEIKSWLDGFDLLNKELSKILASLDIKEVQTSTFDPEIHEAVAQVKVENAQSGNIVEVFEKGYTFKDILLRPAKVSVCE